jgi:predicted AAA+ superfamily ATPase
MGVQYGIITRMKRIYESLIADHFVNNRQMVFLSGPRQVGKTTLAANVLPGAACFNYDKTADALAIAGGADRIATIADLSDPVKAQKGILFDELHKFPKWKNFLKGFFDVYADNRKIKVLVTGSARLDVYKRGGDSMMGRYFPYRVHPLSMGELGGADANLDAIFQNPQHVSEDDMNALMRFGGYPEPFLKGNDRFCNQWKRMRLEKLFEEDIRDMSRVQDLRGLRALAELLAARVGGGVNYASLATDLAVTPDTVKAWIGVLESVYYCYTVTPWFANVANSIRKQPKAYLWDWSLVLDEGARNENFIASHLLKAVHWWTDSGLGDFALHYLRTKQQKEVDFLISKDKTPFMLVECKTSAKEGLSPALAEFQKTLAVPYAFQVAIDAPASSLVPTEFTGIPIKISALDLLKVLV